MINVTGLSIQDIMKISPQEIGQMNESDLRKIASRLVSASNKRLRRAQPTKTGVWSPSIRALADQMGIDMEETGELPQFSLKKIKGTGPNQKAKEKSVKNQLRAVIQQMENFLNAKTSTASGFKKYRKEIEKKLGSKITSSKDRENSFWTAYNRFMKDEHFESIFTSKDGINTVQEWLIDYANINDIYDEDVLYLALHEELGREDNEEEDKFTDASISIKPEQLQLQTRRHN